MKIDKPQPQATKLEKQVLGACMLHVIPVEKLNLTAEMFYDPKHQILFRAILDCNSNGGCDFGTVAQYLRDKGKIDDIGGEFELTKLITVVSTEIDILHHARIIQQKFIARQAETILLKAQDRCHSIDDIADVISDIKRDLTDLIPKVQDDYNKLREKLLIDPTSDLAEPPTYCFIDNRPSMTKGNFSLVDGKKKAGKTFVVGGAVAAMLTNSLIIGKIKGNLPREKNMILYFDTEQSPYHANRSVKRICKLADEPNPSNLLAFGLRPLTPTERLTFIEKTIETTPHLGAVIIDGIRDLLTKGINDEEEATTLTSKFLKWTENYDMHMILLLHQNKNDLNARGHIGTEIGNKAETIITVTKEKNSNIFIVGCEDSKDIGFDEFAFTVDENEMIQSSEVPQEEQSKTKNPQYIDDQKHYELSNSIFKNNIKLSYTELQDAIIYGFGNTFGRNVSRTFITHYLNKGWIIKLRDGHKTFYAYTRATF